MIKRQRNKNNLGNDSQSLSVGGSLLMIDDEEIYGGRANSQKRNSLNKLIQHE